MPIYMMPGIPGCGFPGMGGFPGFPGMGGFPGGYPGMGGYPGGMPGMGGYPGASPFGPQPYPQPYGFGAGHGNLQDAHVGTHGSPFFPQGTEGYGLDLNNNGRYDRGQDGVLGFDLNRDGRVDNREVEESNKRMKALGGNFDANGDGRVTGCERAQGQSLQREMQGHDRNRDGRLDTHEIAAAGGRVLIDHDRNGQFGAHEQYSPYGFPTPGFGAGNLGFVDPQSGYNQTGHVGWGWSWG